jgi:ABC-type amino acid transport substrate-binding protein
MEGLAKRIPGVLELCEPDHDEPDGTPPELLARTLDGRVYVLTIEPENGWEVLP